MKEIRRIFTTAIAIMLLVISPPHAGKKEKASQLKKYVTNGSVMLNDESGNTLISINPDKLFVPASIIKVLTSTIALDLLGEEYRFKTACYTNSRADLIVKGYGDPFLVSDEIRLFAEKLKESGVTNINKIILDHSYFSSDLSIPGISQTSNPYDALNGALVVNFNTVNIFKDASGKVTSAEEETPITPLAIAKGADIAPGKKTRINLSADRSDCSRYAGELLQVIFREKGLTIAENDIGEATISTSKKPAFVYENSRKLPEVLTGLLKYSNNFIANQIFLEIGARRSGPPATMQKSRAVFEQYIRETLGIPKNELVMVEGSGISRNTMVTGKVMISIMERFKPHAGLLTPKSGHPVKSGTLKGVHNYAGYITTDKGLRPFVIMLNQEKNYRDTIFGLLAEMK
jgi:D-alanyl-D-alanine carboxypeptidase/D-alanyl-D-alanine-endopeptidase (penicillin-binding protein 4)